MPYRYRRLQSVREVSPVACLVLGLILAAVAVALALALLPAVTL